MFVIYFSFTLTRFLFQLFLATPFSDLLGIYIKDMRTLHVAYKVKFRVMLNKNNQSVKLENSKSELSRPEVTTLSMVGHILE